MLDEYPSGIRAIEHEANWAWNHALEAARNAERAEPDTVKVARNVLELHAVEGWRLRPLDDLVLPRAFITRRPGQRPPKSDKQALEAMTPAEFLRSFFEEGLAFTAANDDIVWAVLQAYAEAHLTASDARAARTITEATVRALAVRAGMEPMSAELM